MARRTKKKNKARGKSKDISTIHTDNYLCKLSDELLCHILSFLPLRDVVGLSVQNRKLYHAVQLYLRLCKVLDFTEGKLQAYMPPSISDNVLGKLLKTCSKVEKILGLHPWQIEKRRQRNRKCLSIPGILEALSSCQHLKGVEISDLRLMGAILENLPNIEILGHFHNRDGQFPIPNNNFFLHLPSQPKITSLSLTGVEITELPSIPQLKYLYLQWVRFSKPHPFRHFSAPRLHTFILKNSAGPIDAARYVPLAVALAKTPLLKHIEFIRVPFLGGLLQRVVEDYWQKNGFRKLKSIVLGSCVHLLETDIGFLMLASDSELESLKLQPSLSKDSLMLSLKLSVAQFNNLKDLYIGFIDDFPPKGSWTNEELQVEGLADVVELPSPITDAGMKIACQIFPHLELLTINWCPHLLQPTTWTLQDGSTWNYLTNLIFKKCHCLKLDDFVHFLSLLPAIEIVILEDMFYAPPNGCSHVGLSAGTGLGMSSAVISNQQNPLDIVENENINPINPAILEPENNFVNENAMIIENNDHASQSMNDSSDHSELESLIEDSSRKGNNSDSSEILSVVNNINNRDNNSFIPIPTTSGIDMNENSLDKKNHFNNEQSCSQETNKNASKETVLRISDFDKPGTSGVRNSNSFVSYDECEVKFVDRSCQVNANDFRQSTKSGGNSSSSLIQSTVTRPSTIRADNKKSSQKGNIKKKSIKHPKKSMCDKATSTSDPVFLEKPEQDSNVARFLGTTSWGIEHPVHKVHIWLRTRRVGDFLPDEYKMELAFHDPDNSTNLHKEQSSEKEVEVCPIFQTLKLKSSLQLNSLNISDCPQSQFMQILSEIKNLPARRNRTVYIKSKEENVKNNLEKALFEDLECSYHICILDNYYPASDENVLNKQCFLQWMKFFHSINYDLIKKWGFTQTDKGSSTSKGSYPWDKDIYRSNISCCDGDYDVTTDIPWLAELWVPYEKSWNCFYETFHPQVFGYKQYTDCYERLKFCIAEQKELKSNLHLFMLSVYIHRSLDINEA